MRDKQIENLFTTEKSGMQKPDENRKRDTLVFLARKVEKKQIRCYPTVWNALIMQIKYVEKNMLIMQLVFATMFLMLAMQAEIFSGTGSQNQSSLVVISSAVAFLGVFGVMGLGRIFSYHMAELEAACYFSIGQLMVFRMIIYAGINVFIISCYTIFLTAHWQRSVFEVLLYLFVPFLISNCLYFAIFRFIRGRGQKFGLLGAALLSACVPLLTRVYPKIYEQAAIGIWLGLFVVSTLVFALELYDVSHNMSKGEKICLQWN